jgi:pilus assembly protein Flp/PilA
MSLHNGRAPGRLGLHARDDRGATAVEYGLLVALIALVIIAGVTAFGGSVNGLFQLAVAAHPFG